MDAMIIAGGIPLPQEALYAVTRGHGKAMLDVAGKPMIQWVLDALSAAKTIDNLIVAGLTEKSGLSAGKPIHYVPNQGRLLDNLRAGVHKAAELDKKTKQVLLVAADIPAITGEMVDWLVKAAMQSDEDVHYPVIQRQALEKRFPEAKRTYLRFKDVEIAEASMVVARLKAVNDSDNDGFWENFFDTRKSPLQQAAFIGFGASVKARLGQLSLEQAIAGLKDHQNLRLHSLECPYAELGMGVNTPDQLELMGKDFKKQQKKAGKQKGK